MAVQIQLRRDTAANWTSVNTILAQGEVGLELDTGRFKIGDGTTHWSSLVYYAGPGGSTETFVQLNNLTAYTLPNGTVVGQRVLIADNLGVAATNQPVISGNFNIGASITFNFNFQTIEPLWNGTLWIMA